MQLVVYGYIISYKDIAWIYCLSFCVLFLHFLLIRDDGIEMYLSNANLNSSELDLFFDLNSILALIKVKFGVKIRLYLNEMGEKFIY